jgi:hypothetical protein
MEAAMNPKNLADIQKSFTVQAQNFENKKTKIFQTGISY